jgi:uncharacterized membrane protein YkvA (DUF1232 family)
MAENDNQRNLQKLYQEGRFWAKLGKYAKAAGKALVEKALLLFYTIKDPGTPKWAKTVAAGALGYFIFPVDAVPDFIPALGFADDAAVVTAALATLAFSVTPEIKEKARQKLRGWFG